MVSLPYSETSSGQRALTEIEKLLQKFGCDSFGQFQDYENGVTRVQFRWRGRVVDLHASWRGYAAAWINENPWSRNRKSTREEWDAKAMSIGKVAVCSVLRDWVKAQVTAVETGLMTFDAVFMPHLLLPDGSRFIDKAQKLIELPAPARAPK